MRQDRLTGTSRNVAKKAGGGTRHASEMRRGKMTADAPLQVAASVAPLTPPASSSPVAAAGEV